MNSPTACPLVMKDVLVRSDPPLASVVLWHLHQESKNNGELAMKKIYLQWIIPALFAYTSLSSSLSASKSSSKLGVTETPGEVETLLGRQLM
jgi:hypothetical protein